MGPEVLYVDEVIGVLGQGPDDCSLVFVDLQVVTDVDAALVKEGVVVRAEAQDVLDGVWTGVRASQCAYVRAFGNRPTRDLEAHSAHLASVSVQLLDVTRHPRVTDDASSEVLSVAERWRHADDGGMTQTDAGPR